MAEAPKRITAWKDGKRRMFVSSDTPMLSHQNEFSATDYVRSDIADEMLVALKKAEYEIGARLPTGAIGAMPSNKGGNKALELVRAAIAKAKDQADG